MHGQRLALGARVVWLLAVASVLGGAYVHTVLAAGRLPLSAAGRIEQAQPAAAGCARLWVGQEQAIEEALRTAAIERVDVVPIGVTKPKRAFFANGAPIASAAWKALRPGYRSGYYESYKSEIAAYELDKLLGMQMVPPAVERTVEGETGAVVLWLEGVKGWDKDRPAKGPEPEWSRQISRMKLFDQLIANIDRNQGNLLYDADWHLFLIDHSRAFTDRTNLRGMATVGLVDQRLWDGINALTREDLQRVLGPWLEARAIDAILTRRERMREEVKKSVAKLGEARVFLR
jgi:hypothetical protein